MLSRALDQIFFAASTLPDHLTTAKRAFGGDPEKLEALNRLEAALREARAALGGQGRKAA